MYTLYIAAFVLGTALAFTISYYIIHHKFGFINFGRVGSFILIGGATFIDQLNILPWGTILSDGAAKAVGFTLAAAMGMLHLWSLSAPAVVVPVDTVKVS